MTRILGIDPGSRFTGYGVIDTEGNSSLHVASGCIKVTGNSLPEKLGVIFNEITRLIEEHKPAQFAIENVFMNRNADSALKLGQARGAAICAAVTQNIPVLEYAPREIKLAVVGKGGADKQQVQHMVRILLNRRLPLQADEADGLAIALCHAHHQQAINKVPTARRIHGGRLR
jgi:crossover junction endodeoxyribonuclease RuvC